MIIVTLTAEGFIRSDRVLFASSGTGRCTLQVFSLNASLLMSYRGVVGLPFLLRWL